METNNKQLLTSTKEDDRNLITEPYRHGEDGKERLDD